MLNLATKHLETIFENKASDKSSLTFQDFTKVKERASAAAHPVLYAGEGTVDAYTLSLKRTDLFC